MKYGEYLATHRVPGWAAQYVDYDGLKAVIEAAGGFDEQAFVKRVMEEEKRVDLFIGGKIAETVNNLHFLEKNDDDTLADSVAEDIVRVETYIRHNLAAFRKVIKKYAKQTGLSTVWYETNRDQRWLFKAAHVIHELIVQLSQYYARRLEGQAAQKQWQPPTSFARKTVKYWVAAEAITPLKLFIIKHLPILELTKSSRIDWEFHRQRLDQSHNYISSVYLDNDNLDVYHNRIQQLEGAQLFRVRWYGGEIKKGESLPTPRSKQTVFVERKTHHESWVGEPSTKERFSMDLGLLPKFLSGEVPAAKLFEIMQLQGSMSAKDANSLLTLAQETQLSITTMKLEPKIRTVYHRTAFQRSSSNDVRISLDFPCYFVKETNKPNFWSQLNYRDTADPFEYGILEIKTVGEIPPPWVDALLATGWLTRAEKFSKFQTAIATHYSTQCRILPHWVDTVHLPAPVQESKEEKAKGTPLAAGTAAAGAAATATASGAAAAAGTGIAPPAATAAAPTQAAAAISTSTSAMTSPTTTTAPPTSPAPAGPATTKVTSFSPDIHAQPVQVPATASAPRSEPSGAKDTTPAGINHRAALLAAAAVPRSDETAVEMDEVGQLSGDSPKTHKSLLGRLRTTNARRRRSAPGEDTAETSFGSRPPPATGGGGGNGKLSASAPNGSSSKGPNVKKPTLVLRKTNLNRTKIEPKTYFANERTFIQWLSAAILLATLSTAVMSLSDAARIAGTIFFPVALLFMFYALFTYNWRLRKINRRDGTRFDDPYGPWILTIFLSCALVAVVVVNWSTPLASEDTSSNNNDLPLTPRSPVIYAQRSYDSGCTPTPLSEPSWNFAPTSWEIQSELRRGDFWDAEKRYSALTRIESMLGTFFNVQDDVEVSPDWEKTEAVYCLPPPYPDCDTYYIRHRIESQQFIIKYRGPNASFVPYVAKPEYSAETKFEVDAYCETSRLSYSIKLFNISTMDGLNTTFDLNTLFVTPPYDVDVPLIFNSLRRRSNFEYKLPGLAGADAEVNVEMEYANEDDRALGKYPLSVQLQLRLEEIVTSSAVRQGDGLVYYLSQPADDGGLSDGAIVGISLGVLLAILLVTVPALYFHQRRKDERKEAEQQEALSRGVTTVASSA